jgi:hypothetical protein
MLTDMTASSGHGESRHRRRYHRRTGDREVVTVAPFHEVVAAIEAIDLEGPWEALRPRLRLVLPRRRALPPGVDDLPRKRYGPGISVGLGLDVGPAILFVGDEQLRGWGVDRDGAFAQAEANLRDLARGRTTFALLREPIGAVETLAFQSRDGWAASLLLIPDELCRVLGQRTGLILAPMRDLVMWMPVDTDPEFAAWVYEEMADADMNALDLPLLVMVDGELAVARGSLAAAPSRVGAH